ncbi:multiple epidermal growth factor domains 10 [Biomphalaria glabrata]|nr:multiple epidermal growth factor domains 10 [Biomphalaria glabrata]
MTHHYLPWPHITPELFFMLMSRHMKLQISIKTAWYNSSNQHVPLEMLVELNRSVPALLVTIPKIYQHRTNIGIQHTFILVASQDFALAVVLFDYMESTAVFRAMPVDGWGRRYYAVTLGYFIAMVAVTNDGPNTISFTLKAEKRDSFQVYFDQYYRHDFHWDVTLLSYQSYVWSTCNLHVKLGSITGTTIVGRKRFGFISGNCRSYTMTRHCGSKMKSYYDIEGTYDIAVEMLMPFETFGKDFMTFYMDGLQTAGYYIILAGKAFTQVTLHANRFSAGEVISIEKEGDWVSRDIGLGRVTSTKGIQLVYVSRSACKSPLKVYGEPGDPSLCQIVPTSLLYHIYIWRSPLIMQTQNFVAMMVESKNLGQLILNGFPLQSRVNWLDIPGTNGWKFSQYKVNQDLVYNLYTSNANFGCYLYGYSTGTSYMYPAGYISSPINQKCETTLTSSYPGDLIDNDCDERVDEELKNGIDDDYDGEIDEDLNDFKADVTTTTSTTTRTSSTTSTTQPSTTSMTKPKVVTTMKPTPPTTMGTTAATTVKVTTPQPTPKILPTEGSPTTLVATTTSTATASPTTTTSTTKATKTTKKTEVTFTTVNEVSITPGMFSSWSHWMCDRDCQNTRQHRKRLCIRTASSYCYGPTIEWRKSSCYVNRVCPRDCQLYQWDVDCTGSCINCLHDCDKFNGSCAGCKPGFQNPQAGCIEECDEFTYGDKCEGDCQVKCGADCMERINGTCFDTGEYSIWSAWTCTKNCLEPRLHRTRVCLKAPGGLSCQGDSEQWKTGYCYVNTTCPKDCPKFRWDVNCVQSCDSCIQDCDKFNGSCSSCKPGYRLPKYGCVDVCLENTFGLNCLGNCLDNCGADCMDKETGACYTIGVYGPWEQWHCSRDCLNPNMIRKRYCNTTSSGITCQGSNIDSRLSNCYAGKLCPKYCPEFKWDIDCIRSCPNCHSDCDKFTGTCDYCKSGYKYPEKGCNAACEVNEFGVNCVGDCRRQCGEDCADRITGRCPSQRWIYVLALVPICFLPALYLMLKKKSSNVIETIDLQSPEDYYYEFEELADEPLASEVNLLQKSNVSVMSQTTNGSTEL